MRSANGQWRTGNPACPDRQDCLSSTHLPGHRRGGALPAHRQRIPRAGYRSSRARDVVIHHREDGEDEEISVLSVLSVVKLMPIKRVENERERRVRLAAMLRTEPEEHNPSFSIRERNGGRFSC